MDPGLHAAGNDEPYLLLVDDDEVFASTMSRAIARRGYPVRVAGDVDSALAIAQTCVPGYAVVDLRLPGGSGLRLIKRLKEIAHDIRIVLLTGFGSIATTVDAIKLGANYYLTKPANADEVIAALHRDEASEEAAGPLTPPSINRLEWEHINRILTETNGNISASARILGMHRRTLQRKLGKHPVPR
jgi:two-component system, response regulator RegA